MSTVNLSLPTIRKKIEQAKNGSNIIKDNAQRFNKDISALTSTMFRNVSDAVRSNKVFTPVLDQYFVEIEDCLAFLIDESMKASCEREDEDYDRYMYFLPLVVPECSVSHYKDTLNRYRSILAQEIDYAVEHGYTDDLAIFLANPQGYVSRKKDGLIGLKTGIEGVSGGVSYSLSDNLKKLGISVAALSYVNTEMYLWKTKSEIVGYFGVRNSNYPCPLCDEYANIFIPISQGMIYPLHNRCVCGVIPITQSELI